MTVTSWPRVDEDTTDAQYAELFNSIIGSGVRDASSFVVSADSSGLNVKVSAGFATVAGTACLSTASVTLTIAPNTGSTTRTDLIVLRRDFTATAGQTARLMVKTGPTTADSDLTGNYDLVLATVSVAAGAATITPANVTSLRPFMSRRVGVWDDSTRPAHRIGTLGVNTTSGRYEYSDGTAWAPLASWDTLPGRPANLPIAQGGTGGNSKAAAREALGITSGTAAPSNSSGDDGDIYFQKI